MKLPAAVFLCVSLTVLPPSAAIADEPVDTVQSVIQQQIAAFLNDDAAAAYSFASPTIRGKFPSESQFFDMVKRGYAPVYRPGNFAFGRAKVSGDTVVQEVLISGSDGKDWTAFYQVVKQPDGSYKINGVHMVKAAPGSAI
ncbi:DUF4864 domain-containing protein [Rhizobium sp. TRM95111]|uniref:DUF4864 domain-containing protein n=1 Tax=Rhizobium alarense TaxID=2846851 RepID=UPI001F29C9FF|nr:DUF4864 domain-containing protein [Rhizobium alarense]MCF3638704.1 DUF4864 domain-containing protein [Rhizobium alarense]